MFKFIKYTNKINELEEENRELGYKVEELSLQLDIVSKKLRPEELTIFQLGLEADRVRRQKSLLDEELELVKDVIIAKSNELKQIEEEIEMRREELLKISGGSEGG